MHMEFICGIEVTLYSTTLLKTVMFSVPPAAWSNCGHGKQALKCRILRIILVSTLVIRLLLYNHISFSSFLI